MSFDESQLRAFLGTAGYYRELCQTMPTLRPLCTVHAKRGTFLDGQLKVRKPSWTLSANCRMPPSLLSPRWGYRSAWTASASDSGLGALLSQVQNGKERVIAYAARALSKAEKNSTSRHPSMLDIFWPGLTIVLCNG